MVVTTGPDGTTVSTPMSPEAAAHMEALVSEAFGQVDPRDFGPPGYPPQE